MYSTKNMLSDNFYENIIYKKIRKIYRIICEDNSFENRKNLLK